MESDAPRAGLLRQLPALAAVVALGALNSVVGKIRAVKLGVYDGLIAGLINAFVYFLVYVGILCSRLRSGLVTPAEIRFTFGARVFPARTAGGGPLATARRAWERAGIHKLMIVGGAADCTTQVLTFVALPSVSIIVNALLSQTTALFNMLWSMALLDSRFVALELLGIAIALSGAALTVFEVASGGGQGTKLQFALLIVVSCCGMALSFVLKEKCFRAYSSWRAGGARAPAGANAEVAVLHATDGGAPLLPGETGVQADAEGSAAAREKALPRELDIWCVNSAAALWSLIWVLPITIVTSLVQKPAGASVPAFAADGFRCFANLAARGAGAVDDDTDDDATCAGAWQWYVAYMAINLCYNYSIYWVVRHHSALLAFVTIKAVTPTAALLSLLRWPVIGRGSMSSLDGVSLSLIVVGVAVFRHGASVREAQFGGQQQRTAEMRVCCWPIR